MLRGLINRLHEMAMDLDAFANGGHQPDPFALIRQVFAIDIMRLQNLVLRVIGGLIEQERTRDVLDDCIGLKSALFGMIAQPAGERGGIVFQPCHARAQSRLYIKSLFPFCATPCHSLILSLVSSRFHIEEAAFHRNHFMHHIGHAMRGFPAQFLSGFGGVGFADH